MRKYKNENIALRRENKEQKNAYDKVVEENKHLKLQVRQKDDIITKQSLELEKEAKINDNNYQKVENCFRSIERGSKSHNRAKSAPPK